MSNNKSNNICKNFCNESNFNCCKKSNCCPYIQNNCIRKNAINSLFCVENFLCNTQKACTIYKLRCILKKFCSFHNI